MVNTEMQQQAKKNVLILCVDRDGDIEVKAGIKTPLLGRNANLDAAVALALKDPEEPDANAMFEAVRLYDQLTSKKEPHETFEVASISGTEAGGVTADRKLSSELDNVLESYAATEIVFVSDGYTDEEVFPIIQTRKVPISSVRRIVIKHSESIEETAAVFTKYLKLLVDTPRYSRVALGLPGILVTVLAFFWILNVRYNVPIIYYGIAIATIVGAFLLLKGFGVDRATKKSYTWVKEYSPPPLPMQIANYTIIAGLLCSIISLYLGFRYVNLTLSQQPITDFVFGISQTPRIIALFIKGAMDLLIIGTILVLVGRSVTFYFEKNSKLKNSKLFRNATLIAEVAWARAIMGATVNLLLQSKVSDEILIGFENEFFKLFIISIIVGILIGVAAILLFMVLSKSSKGLFKKEEVSQEVDSSIMQETNSNTAIS
jgi:putative membrane protein